MRTIHVLFSLFLLLCMGSFYGCSMGLVTQEIRGTVTYKGVPIEGARIGMTPIDDPKGIPAFGRTNAQGEFTITTLRGGRDGGGAQIGSYRVTIVKEIPGREMTAAEKKAYDEQGVVPNIEPENILPNHYASADTSGLEVQVKKGKNVYEFILQDE